MELGTKIKRFREKAKLTQKQLADHLEVTPQSVSKWENLTSMPDVSLLPRIAEIFGVTIDELFDLSVEEKLNRIENRMEIEMELEEGKFKEYEQFLKEQIGRPENKKRATSLLAHLYGYRMMAFAQKTDKYAKEAILLEPDKKDCQWLLSKSSGYYAWDWNIHNHTHAIAFFRELVDKNPNERLPYFYLLDNLIVDHRTEEAERYLEKFKTLEGVSPITVEVYRANIALARFDEAKADRIIEELVLANPDDSIALFEAAQYHAAKCDYDKAIVYYEKSFARGTRRPRFIDELQAIADIYEIRGDYKKAAETYDRIIKCQKEEWGLTEESELKESEKKRNALLAKAR